MMTIEEWATAWHDELCTCYEVVLAYARQYRVCEYLTFDAFIEYMYSQSCIVENRYKSS